VLRQLGEDPDDLRLRLRDDCRPSAASPWRRRWFERLSFGAKSLHRLDLPPLPHPRRHPSWAGLPTAGEPVDLASGLLGVHLGKPPLPAIVHGRERLFLAFVGKGTGATPAMELTAFFAGHRPLPAEAATMTHAGAAALLVFAMRDWFCHRRDLSMQMAKS
jgi:hypothetical protein